MLLGLHVVQAQLAVMVAFVDGPQVDILATGLNANTRIILKIKLAKGGRVYQVGLV